MSWQWAGRKGGAWPVVQPSLPDLGWSNRVNLSIGLGNCAQNKDFQEPKTGPCAGTFAYFDLLTSSMKLVNITSLITDSCMTMQYT